MNKEDTGVGTKRTKTSGQESIMEDVWAALVALEEEFGLTARISLLRGVRKGIWKVRYDVFSVVDRKPFRRIIEVQAEWPSSVATTLESFLLQKVTEGYNRAEEAVEVERQQQSF